jgi:hypothetical protein
MQLEPAQRAMEPAAGGEMATSFVYARDGSLT